MRRSIASTESNWDEYLTLFSMFDRAGVPVDSRWRSLLLFFRDTKDHKQLSDTQKIAIQSLMTSILENKDYSEKRLDAVFADYLSILAKPHQVKIDALLREVSDVIAEFQKMLSIRCGDISSLEKETVTVVNEDFTCNGDASYSVGKLRTAFGRVKSLLENDIRNLEDMATHDGMTGLANRRAFNMFMDAAITRWLAEDRPLMLALFDIDYFKRFNDEHGHRIGDQVLSVVGTHLKKAIADFDKPNDTIAARYGGEEFVLAVSGSDAARLVDVTEKCRNVIKKFNFLIRDADGNVVESGLHITVSAGVAAAWKGWPGAYLENLIDSADKALYFAKQSGRDRAVFFRPEEENSFSLIPSAAR